MSYSLAIADGDLVSRGSRLDVVYGVEKLKQDLYCWLTERYGGDRFHVNMGTILEEFIGGIANESTRSEVQSEIFRVLQNYQAMQLKRFKENPEKMATSELLVSIDDIMAVLDYYSIQVAIKLRNGTNESTTIKITSGQSAGQMVNPPNR
jgi:hypothetical protein